jgi:hypothetical protein
MREALMTLDTPNGLGTAFLRSGRTVRDAKEAICARFGGCTSLVTDGCWVEMKPNRPNETRFVNDASITFRVGIDATFSEEWDAFKQLAIHLADGQESVYVVDAWGAAHILQVEPVLPPRNLYADVDYTPLPARKPRDDTDELVRKAT